ncbi:delta(14)-sterol reductase TM7SF2 isoform X1 [Onychomys torridus]|uniref:delta(14)-sterol reductase TM7SF2 isoform X1 n=1 Tax=Onychomys torridus TaxID=38674 RepID=UPI00167F6121|nr:delta(14)-sterol reductase TM7SF2 isoform X1 [Onychomys torridus]
MGRGRVHLKTAGQEQQLSHLSVHTEAEPSHQDGAGCVPMIFCEPSLPGKAEIMTPHEAAQAPLEFGGPLGVTAMMVLLPATMFHLLLAARSGPARLLGPPAYLPGLEELWSPWALLLLFMWLGLQVALYLLPARKVAEGMELKDKSRLRYPINGFQALVLTALLVGLGVSAGLPLGALPEMLLPLAFATTLTSFSLSLLLYAKALAAPVSALAPGGNSGNSVYDFFLGRELNPRLGSFDFKYFCELRPGLIGWVLINLALLVQEAELRGSPSLAMWLVNGFQLLYVGDALWYEESVLTTMDIIHDGFGFMLAFGDLAWVPFTYSLQAQFLLYHPQPLGLPMALLICLLKAIGYYIFRGANSQKNTFRKNPSDPSVAGLETIPTATGRHLLVSGWWGMVRHPNYLGDLIMALAWSLPCGPRRAAVYPEVRPCLEGILQACALPNHPLYLLKQSHRASSGLSTPGASGLHPTLLGRDDQPQRRG